MTGKGNGCAPPLSPDISMYTSSHIVCLFAVLKATRDRERNKKSV